MHALHTALLGNLISLKVRGIVAEVRALVAVIEEEPGLPDAERTALLAVTAEMLAQTDTLLRWVAGAEHEN